MIPEVWSSCPGIYVHACIWSSSIWRPITFPLQTSLLALCDVRPVSQRDLVAANIVVPRHLCEAYELLYHPNHRWIYKQGMGNSEVIGFKPADTAESVACREQKLRTDKVLCFQPFVVCPHSAFRDFSVTAGTPEGASVEVRVIAIDCKV